MYSIYNSSGYLEKGKQVRYFEKKTIRISDKAQLVSYKVARLIVVQLKSHTIKVSNLAACYKILLWR